MTAIASHPSFQIPSKDDPKELPDPFNDLSVGGWEITEEPVGRLSVWAVSLQGKVSHYHCAQDLTWQRRLAAGWTGAGVSQGGEESSLPPVLGTGTSCTGREFPDSTIPWKPWDLSLVLAHFRLRCNQFCLFGRIPGSLPAPSSSLQEGCGCVGGWMADVWID